MREHQHLRPAELVAERAEDQPADAPPDQEERGDDLAERLHVVRRRAAGLAGRSRAGMRARENSRWSRQSNSHAADATMKTNQW